MLAIGRVIGPEAAGTGMIAIAAFALLDIVASNLLPGIAGGGFHARLVPPPSPTLTNLPLLRWREGAALIASTHRLAPIAMAASQPRGVLLHFKFPQDFHDRALDAVTRDAHWDGSREYRRYLARIVAQPGFTMPGPRSRA